MTSLVSVVIPTYNSADTLPRAIESVLDQTYDNIELLVVDDGSKDSTGEVMANYSNEKIQFYQHESNQGGSSARNTGIDHAVGEYIAFLDADDEWLPKKVELQVNKLDSKGDDYVAVHCDRKYERSFVGEIRDRLAALVGTIETNPPKEGGAELIKEILLMNLSTGASTLLVKADAIEAIGGFDESFPRHQDWEFLIRLLRQGKLTHIDQELVIKHITGQPGGDTLKVAKIKLFESFSSEISQLESEGYPVIDTQHFHLGKRYIQNGNFVEGLSWINTSDLTLPNLLSLGWSSLSGIRSKLVKF